MKELKSAELASLEQHLQEYGEEEDEIERAAQSPGRGASHPNPPSLTSKILRTLR